MCIQTFFFDHSVNDHFYKADKGTAYMYVCAGSFEVIKIYEFCCAQNVILSFGNNIFNLMIKVKISGLPSVCRI